MNWLNDYLEQQEEVIFRTRVHWYNLFGSTILLALGFINAWFLLAVAALVVYNICRLLYYEYVITNERVIIKKGWFYIRTVDILLEEIDDVLIKQSLSEKITGGGTIFIFGIKISTTKLTNLQKPKTFRNALFSQLPATSVSYYEEQW